VQQVHALGDLARLLALLAAQLDAARIADFFQNLMRYYNLMIMIVNQIMGGKNDNMIVKVRGSQVLSRVVEGNRREGGGRGMRDLHKDTVWQDTQKYRPLLQNVGLFCRALVQKRPMFLGSLLMRDLHKDTMGQATSPPRLFVKNIGLFCRIQVSFIGRLCKRDLCF